MRALWAVLLVAGCAAPGRQLVRAAVLPADDVSSADGRSVSLRTTLAGSVAVIDLWATWCTACERERPKLERLQAAYRERGLQVIGLDVGESPSVVGAYLAERHIAYPVFLDPDFHLADALGEKQLPTILVVDRAGRIVHRATSLDPDTLQHVKSLFAGELR